MYSTSKIARTAGLLYLLYVIASFIANLVSGAKLVFPVRKVPNIGELGAIHARYSGVSSPAVSFAPRTRLGPER